ncbi:hec [Drosophila busckii]|uniref:Hec n=1 Tax=Drosophila busckii TaxID=30019 RepID=A0A0M5J328_DROBS|nr:hec [Drosophila busckii]
MSVPEPQDNLLAFVRHLYLECINRYRNYTPPGLATDELLSTNYTLPTFLEDAVLNEGSIDMQDIDELSASEQELYATMATNQLANSNASAAGRASGLYCPTNFDGYLCWPPTPAGTVLSQRCPNFVEGFNARFLARKTCLSNGSWLRHPESNKIWSNYTNCVDTPDLEFRQLVNELYVRGYALSLLALLLSIIIFLGFKSLRCTRIRIHVHLFVSLAFSCLAWILWYRLVVEHSDIIAENPVFVKDTIVMRWFKLLSWLSPVLIVAAYGAARHFGNDNAHCWINDSFYLWIFSVPITISLLASFIFLINVLRVIVRKLHPQSAQPAPLAIRKAVRATIILVPLFGLQHFLLPYRPDAGSQLDAFYQLLSVALVSLQGFVVSFLFCFVNHDVTFAIRTLLNKLMPRLVAAPPAGSNTGHMATTTPSRELGV